MKFVLAGSQAHFDRFKEVLWSKDKDVRDYRYINRIDTILGAGEGNELVVLASATEHPQYEYLHRECEARGILRRIRRRNENDARIGHGIRPRDDTQPILRPSFESLIPSGDDSIMTTTDGPMLTLRADAPTIQPLTAGPPQPRFQLPRDMGRYEEAAQEAERQRAEITEADRILTEFDSQEQEAIRPEEREEVSTARWGYFDGLGAGDIHNG